jgi:hypothetical protein
VIQGARACSLSPGLHFFLFLMRALIQFCRSILPFVRRPECSDFVLTQRRPRPPRNFCEPVFQSLPFFYGRFLLLCAGRSPAWEILSPHSPSPIFLQQSFSPVPRTCLLAPVSACWLWRSRLIFGSYTKQGAPVEFPVPS